MPLLATSNGTSPYLHGSKHNADDCYHSHTLLASPSNTVNQQAISSLHANFPRHSASSASLKLMPLINRFESLDAASLELAMPNQNQSPLETPQNRSVNKHHINFLEPPNQNVHKHEHVRLPKTSAMTSKYSILQSDPAMTKCLPHKQVHIKRENTVQSKAEPDIISMRNSLEETANRGTREPIVKLNQPASIKDKIRFFNLGIASDELIIKNGTRINHLPTTPLTTRTQSPSTFSNSIPKQNITHTKTSPITSTKPGQLPAPQKTDFTVKKGIDNSIEPSFAWPLFKATIIASNGSPTLPKVKLSGVYTENSQLPARGRALLWKDSINLGPRLERTRSSTKSASSPFRDGCRGKSIVPVGSEHLPIHERRRNINNKVEAIYRERNQQDSPSRINDKDGKNSAQSERRLISANKSEDDALARKIGSKVARLRKLFVDSETERQNPTSCLALPTTSSSLQVHGSPKNEILNPAVSRIAAFTATSQEHGFWSNSKIIVSQSVIQKSVQRLEQVPAGEQIGELKPKVGEKVKLFEGITKGREKIERQFQGSGKVLRRKHPPWKQSFLGSRVRGSNYSEMNEVTCEFSSIDNSDGKKEGKRLFLSNIWNDLKSARYGEDKTGGNNEWERLIVKEVQCGLNEPKPMRLAELNRMMELCKGFGDRIGAGGSRKHSKKSAESWHSESGSMREK